MERALLQWTKDSKNDDYWYLDFRVISSSIVGLNQYISGVILFEETLYQKGDDGTLFVDMLKKEHIIPGIKVRNANDDGLDHYCL